MWQEIITGIIVIAVFIYVGYKLYRILIHPEQVKCNCGCKGCPSAKQKHQDCCH